METFQILGVLYFIINLAWKYKDKIIKNKIGRYIAAPFVVPYFIYLVFKLYNDKLLMDILDKIEKQKKIDDFLN